MGKAFMIIVQLLITFTGVVAVWLSLCKTDRVRRWGPVFGLLGQPFWFTLFLKNDQPLMLGICGLYTFTWARGFWMFWIKPWRARRAMNATTPYGPLLDPNDVTDFGRCGYVQDGRRCLLRAFHTSNHLFPETAPERCCLLPPNHAGDCRF